MTSDNGWGKPTNIMTTTLRLTDGTNITIRDTEGVGIELVARQSGDGVDHALAFMASLKEAQSLASIFNRTVNAVQDAADEKRAG